MLEANAPDGGMVRPPAFMQERARAAPTAPRKHNSDGETPFSARLRKELTQLYNHFRVKLFRNNVGRLQDRFGNWVQFGLCVGSSDNIGWRSVIIKPEWVNRRIAVFCAAEAKTNSDTAKDDQEFFLASVRHAGGIGIVINATKGEAHAIQQIMDWQPAEKELPAPIPARMDDALPW